MASHFGVSKSAMQGRLRELAKRGYLCLGEGKLRERAIDIKHVRFQAVVDE